MCKSLTYENVGLVKRSSLFYDPDMVAFHTMVKKIRSMHLRLLDNHKTIIKNKMFTLNLRKICVH